MQNSPNEQAGDAACMAGVWKLGTAKAVPLQKQSWTCTLWYLRTTYSKGTSCKRTGYHKLKTISFQSHMCTRACRWLRKRIRYVIDLGPISS